MRRLASIFMITGFFLILPLSPVHLSAAPSAPDDTESYPFKGCQMVPTMIILSGGLKGTVQGTRGSIIRWNASLAKSWGGFGLVNNESDCRTNQ
jgi:hypothetical protein